MAETHSNSTMRQRRISQSRDDGQSIFKKCRIVTLVLVLSFIVTTLLLTQQFDIRELRVVKSYQDGHASRISPNRTGQRKHPQYRPEAESEYVESDEQLIERVKHIRVLCVILTMEKDLTTKVAAVNSTWAKRCDKRLYVLKTNLQHQEYLIVNEIETRNTIVNKIRTAFTTIYDTHLDKFDFLLKTDDDSYIVMDNLKFLLSHYKPYEPAYLGFHFNHFIKNGYMSGGAGYVISNRALRQLVERGWRAEACKVVPQKEDKENSEDLELGRCLEFVGVPPLSSLDLEGKETFHAYPLEKWLSNSIPRYMYEWAQHPIQTGKACCSRYTISFHYMPPHAMFYMDFLLYDMSVFGHAAIPRSPVFRIGQD